MKKFKIMGIVLISLLFVGVVNAETTTCESTNTKSCVANATDLKTALDAGKSVLLTSDIELKENMVLTGSGTLTIESFGNKVYTVSNKTTKKTFEVHSSGELLKLTFKNVNITNSYTGIEGRCIDTRTNNIELTLENVELTATGGANTQVLNIGGSKGINKVTINNSTITANASGYGVVTFNPVDLMVNNSTISGYSALYFKGVNSSEGSQNSVVIVKNKSVLQGTSHLGETFGVMTFEDHNITVNVENSTIYANLTQETGKDKEGNPLSSIYRVVNYSAKDGKSNIEYVTDPETGKTTQVIKEYASNNKITFSGSTKIVLGEGTGVALLTEEKAENTIALEEGVTINAEVNSKYLKEGHVAVEKDGNYTVYKENKVNVATVTGGTVTVDKTKAITGETVTITVTPNEGYELVTLTVVDADNKEVTIENNKFVMPNGEVTVTATLTEVETTVSLPVVDTEIEVEEVVVGVKESEVTEEVLLESLTEMLKDEEQKELAEALTSSSAVVEVEIAKVEEKAVEESVVEKMQEKAGKATIAAYFDVTVAVRNASDGSSLGTIPELTKEIELMVLLPKELKNTNKEVNRTYYVVREHNGVVDKFEAKLSEDGKSLVFKSNKFSTYALAYEDAKVVDTKVPQTFDGISMYLVLGTVSLLALLGASLYIKKRNFN